VLLHGGDRSRARDSEAVRRVASIPRGIPFASRFQITALTSARSSGATVSRSTIDATISTS
jgi:hypothetical protein